LSKNITVVDNLVINRFEGAMLSNQSFIMLGDLVFFFIYPKEVIMNKAKESTELCDSNDPECNFQRFGLTSKALNKKRVLKSKRQRKFLEKFHIRTRNKNEQFNLNNNFGSKSSMVLPELKNCVMKKFKYFIVVLIIK